MPNTRYCPHCGASVALGDRFCGACGGRTGQQVATEVTEPVHEQSGAAEQSATPPRAPTTAAEQSAIPPRAPTTAADPEPAQPTVAAAAGPSRTADQADGRRPQAFDLTKISRTEVVVAVCGLVAFIASFLSWYEISISGVVLFSDNAWKAGLISWLSVLLLIAIGIGAVLPAFGQRALAPIVTVGVGLVCIGLLVVRIFTFPSDSSVGGGTFGVSQGAGVGLYVALVAALVVTVVGLLSGGAAAIAGWYAKTTQQRRSGTPPQAGS